MVDNCDSFTYNVVHPLQRLRADVVVRRSDEIDVNERAGRARGERAHGGRRGHGGAPSDLPIEGVQFHPESLLTPEGPQLLENFLLGARCRARP